MIIKVSMVEPKTARNRCKVKYFSAVLKGTTFTGHPTRTTLGNTLRMMYYTLYIAYKAGVVVYSCHAGDDVVIVLEACDVEKFK